MYDLTNNNKHNVTQKVSSFNLIWNVFELEFNILNEFTEWIDNKFGVSEFDQIMNSLRCQNSLKLSELEHICSANW